MTTSLRAWLDEGPFTLALSSGFFGFFAHAGVLAALDEAGVRPSRVAGASAGALAGGSWAAGLSGEELGCALFAIERRDFWDLGLGPGLLRGALFRERLERLLPVSRIEECRVPLAVSVYDLLGRRTRALTEGPLATAIHASCAVPGMFHPVWIDGRPHVDGGLAERAGLVGVPPAERVLAHFLASRSPWRAAGSPLLRPPERPGMRAFVIEDLPRVGPFRLGEGRKAFERGRDHVRRLLEA